MVDGIAYNIRNDYRTVEVTYSGRLGNDYPSFHFYSFGMQPCATDLPHHYVTNNYNRLTDMVIPETVSYNGKTYTVVGLGECAFNGASFDRLSLPPTITYASRGCFGEIADTIPNSLGINSEHGVQPDQTHIAKLEIADIGAWCNIQYDSFQWDVDAGEHMWYGERETNIGTITPTYTSHYYSYSLSYAELYFDEETGEETEQWYYDSWNTTIESVSHRELYVGGNLLTDLVVPDEVTQISTYAFIGNPALRSLTLHKGVDRIADKAFSECTGLRNIYCYAIRPADIALGKDVFGLIPTESCVLHVPKGSKVLYQQADQWREFGNIVADLPTEGILGDFNGDNTVDINDVNAIINAMLNDDNGNELYDIDGDGKTDVTDLNLLINFVLIGDSAAATAS